MILRTSSVLFFLFAPAPGTAFALDMEFYTYGGFEVVLEAWQMVALIFSDAGYQALFFSVIALGIFLGGAAAYVKLLMGGKGSALAWAWPVGMGVVLYVGAVVPKGSLTIYDPVLNRFQQVGNIPNGLVLVSGILNRIESGLVDIIHTSGSVKDYRNSAGGIGFNALIAATNQQLMVKDEYFMQSLDRYNKDCLFFELQRPGTNISYEQIKNQATDFTAIWSEAANPAVFTVFYNDMYKTGTTMSCRDAWAALQADLNAPASYDRALRQICPVIGFNVDDMSQYLRCRDLIGDYSDYIHNGLAGSMQNFLRQSAMARALEYTLMKLSPDLATAAQLNRSAMTSGIGSWIAANEWIPITRAVFTAICIGMVPFVLLMFPTGLVNKALGLIAGFFVWLACWGVCDAIMHVLANRVSYNIMEGVRQGNLGYTAIMLWPSYGMKALSQFGMMRTGSMMIAALITGALVRFGGHALAIMAQSHSGRLQSLGATAARGADALEGGAANIEAWRSAVPTWTNAQKFDFDTDTSARSVLKMGQTGAGAGFISSRGGIEAASDALAHKRAGDMISGAAEAGQLSADDFRLQGEIAGQKQAGYISQMSPENARSLGVQSAGAEMGGLRAVLQQASAMEGGLTEANLSRAARDLGYLRPASQLARLQGIRSAVQSSGFQGNELEFMAAVESVSSMKGYADAVSYDSAMRTMAEKYFGGETGKAYSAVAAYHNVQAAEALGTMMADGFTPRAAGQYMAHMEGLRRLAQIDAHRAVGDPVFRSSLSAQQLDSLAKYDVQRRIAGVLAGDSSDRGFIDFARQAHGGANLVLTSEMAGRLNRHMHDLGWTNFRAGEGNLVAVGFNPATGKFGFAHGRGGGYMQHYNLESSDTGQKATVYDHFRQKVGGYLDQHYDYRISKTAGPEGFTVSYADRNTGRIVHSTMSGLVEKAFARDGMATRKIFDQTGEELHSYQVRGMEREWVNFSRQRMGAEATGSFTEMVKEYAGEGAALSAAQVGDIIGQGMNIGRGFGKVRGPLSSKKVGVTNGKPENVSKFSSLP
ncbi:MAG TPA: conjugal transfer protein TraG N-terminal domain-containing protein [Syntrophales bacterium]|nr:conjugal transfer protein TraG N-terminal domain-containing protein [Syntrophales bacterium]